MNSSHTSDYDIIFLGGGISASLFAISLGRKIPELKMMIVEEKAVFPHKVGESLSDIAALFLNRFEIDELLDKHIPKAGLRFLFQEPRADNKSNIQEFSSPSLPGVASGRHLRRDSFDEDLLEEAASLGIEVMRPASVTGIEVHPFSSRIQLAYEGSNHSFQSTWVVDVTGRRQFLSHQMDWKQEELPIRTGAIIAHFHSTQEVKHDPPPSRQWTRAIAPPSQATIHFLKKGCWWYHISLDDHTSSIGLVYHQEQIKVEDPAQFFEQLLQSDAQLQAITAGASRGMIRHLPQLAFVGQQLYDEGIILLGDACGFVDPMFSPGLEFTCQQISWLTDLLTAYFSSRQMNSKRWRRYEKTFRQAYLDRARQFDMNYRLMFSYDLFSNWAQMGIFAYFTFSVLPAVKFPRLIRYPLRFNLFSRMAFRFFRWRYLSIAQKRMSDGRVSSSLPQPVVYSYVSVPQGIGFYFKPLHLAWNWLINYLRIEWTELLRFVKTKKGSLD
ncbi:MAG: tryptophan 7-halogenase [Bacteroidota bacterium]